MRSVDVSSVQAQEPISAKKLHKHARGLAVSMAVSTLMAATPITAKALADTPTPPQGNDDVQLAQTDDQSALTSAKKSDDAQTQEQKATQHPNSESAKQPLAADSAPTLSRMPASTNSPASEGNSQTTAQTAQSAQQAQPAQSAQPAQPAQPAQTAQSPRKAKSAQSVPAASAANPVANDASASASEATRFYQVRYFDANSKKAGLCPGTHFYQ